MTPNLTSTNNFFYNTVNHQKNEPLDLTLHHKLCGEHLSKSGKKLSSSQSLPNDEHESSESSPSNTGMNSPNFATNNDENESTNKQRLSLARKWVKTHVRMSKDATLSFYTIFMTYIQFCNEKNELPILPFELLHMLQFEFVQNETSAEIEDELKQEFSTFQNLKLDDAVDVQSKLSTLKGLENIEFRCAFLKGEKDDEYASDSNDSAVSSLDSEHEDAKYENDGFKNSSDKDSSYESLDESSNESTTPIVSDLKEASLLNSKQDQNGTPQVMCFSSSNHVNKAMEVETKEETCRDGIQLIRVSRNSCLEAKKVFEFDEQQNNNKEPIEIQDDKPIDIVRVKRELENDIEVELVQHENGGKKLKYHNRSQILPAAPTFAVKVKSDKYVATLSKSAKHQNGSKQVELPVNKIRWSKSQELIIEGVVKILSLEGYESSPCYKDAKGFAQTLIQMLRNKQLKMFLTVFAHAMTCKEKHRGLCFMFKRILHHITRAEHNCAVKFVYGHVLRLHLDTCGSDVCGFTDCKNLREIRKTQMASAALKI